MTVTELINTYEEIIIFDTEYTTWEGAMERGWSGPNEYRELVQLSAARVRLADKQVVDTLSLYFKPVLNPVVSTYFSDLTGIDQATIDVKGVLCEEGIQQFLEWTGGTTCFSYAYFDRPLADGHILLENIELYNLPLALPTEQFKNISSVFAAAGVPITEYNSGKLHQFFNLPATGREHEAMHDVMSITDSLFTLY